MASHSMSREELAWAAGFFDREGWVGSVRTAGRDPFVCIGITQVDRRVLDRFRAAVGLGHVYGPTKAYGASQPQHRYHVSHHPKVQAVCAMLWTWLSPVKRAQFRTTLAETTALLLHRPPCEHGSSTKWTCRECLR